MPGYPQHARQRPAAAAAGRAAMHGDTGAMTVDAVSDLDLDLSYTPPLGSPWEAVQMGAQAWDRAAQPR